jgi:putative DNA primase/helicase
MTGIPFDALRSAALAIAPSLLADWFPRGRTFGREFKIGSIRGEAGESLSINLNTGVWKDFASNESGADLIDLRAAMIHSGDIGAAARELARILGVSVNGADRYAGKPPSPRQAKARGDDWQPMVPPPDGTAPPPQTALSDFDAYFEYTDANDSVTHYVGRIEARNGRPKLFIPLTYGILDGTQGWHKRKPGDPLPLYGLNRLAAFPDAEVILCEGEKAADAAQALFPDRPCLSWFGGTGSVGYADLAPLQGRRVIIWPDADEAGRKAAAKLATKISSARTLRVDNLPDKFDAADLIVDDPEAWLADRLPPPPKPDDALGIWDACWATFSAAASSPRLLPMAVSAKPPSASPNSFRSPPGAASQVSTSSYDAKFSLSAWKTTQTNYAAASTPPSATTASPLLTSKATCSSPHPKGCASPK